MLIAATLACFYSGRGRTRVIMWANVVGALVNIILDYPMIFGWGPFPAWGVWGAAVATVIGSGVIAALYVVLIWLDADAAQYRLFKNMHFEFALFKRLLRFGLPNGLNWFVDIFCYTAFIQMIGNLGTAQLAATNLAFNLNSLLFIPLLGIGTAIATLVGQRIGEGAPELAERTTWKGFAIAGSYTLAFAAIYLLAPNLILLPYEVYSQPEEFATVREYVVTLLQFVAIYAFFDCMAIVFGSAIRGAGDTRFALIFAAITGLGLLVLPTYIYQRYYDGELSSAWWSATIFIIVIGTGFLLRFLGGRWKTMRVIERGPELIAEPALAAD